MGMRQAVFELSVAHDSSKLTISELTYELEEKSKEVSTAVIFPVCVLVCERVLKFLHLIHSLFWSKTRLETCWWRKIMKLSNSRPS